jgi:hypothetical protein
MPFHSVPSFGIGSYVEHGMPRNECFLLRNNGNCSESIPRNFFGTILDLLRQKSFLGTKVLLNYHV